MKIITYHYIRSFDKKYPYFNFLDKKLFNKQLKFFEKKYGIIKNRVRMDDRDVFWVKDIEPGGSFILYGEENK